MGTAKMHYYPDRRLFLVDASDLALTLFPRRLQVRSHRTGVVTRFDFSHEMWDSGDMDGVEYKSQDGYILQVRND